MKRLSYSLRFLWIAAGLCLLAACTTHDTDLQPDTPDDEAVLLQSIEATLLHSETVTKATTIPPTDPDYVGRHEFVEHDLLQLTKFQRTNSPKNVFTYPRTGEKLRWQCGSNGAWSRYIEGTEEETRIYWSDGSSYHTAVAFSLPQQKEAATPFTWAESGGVYYGQLGNSGTLTAQDTLDYTDVYNSENPATVTTSGNDKMKWDDLLLSYSDALQVEPGGAIAKLKFRHALSCLMVEVNINGFSTSTSEDVADNKAKVYDLVIKDQPIHYKWKGTSDGVEGLNATEDDGNAYLNVKKPIKAWLREPAGTGDGMYRTFRFHTLMVPGTGRELPMEFTVSYPNPLNTAETLIQTYQATAHDIDFNAGQRTVVKVTLNHKDESATIGASYVDWEYIDTPDYGSLAKNSTFLDTVDPNEITLHTKEGLVKDDATWLYKEGENVMDIDGNDGTISKPFRIRNARQLLAFAYEVKNGYDFAGQYVQLDADLFLQPSQTADNLVWPGIGDASHPFKGVFWGGGRTISRLNGNPLFAYVGQEESNVGRILDLELNQVVGCTGRGVLVEKNEGILCACHVKGDFTSDKETVGGLAGTSNYCILVCSYIGQVTGATTVGGLVGENSGYVVASFHSGALTATGEGGLTYGCGKNASLSTGEESSPTPGPGFIDCFYNSALATPTAVDGVTGAGKTTEEMQSSTFVETLNTAIDNLTNNGSSSQLPNYLIAYLERYKYVLRPASYPIAQVVDKTTGSE